MSPKKTQQQQQQDAALAKTGKADARKIEGELSDDDLSLVTGGRQTPKVDFGTMIRTGKPTGKSTTTTT